MKRIAAFIDFQGTIGGEGTDDIRFLELYDFSAAAIKLLNDNHVLAIGITNQSQISKGKLSMDDYTCKLELINRELAKHKARFDDVFCCPHSHKDNCSCKKPLPGMINLAKEKYDIRINESYVIGDMGKSDMLLAKNVGAKGVLVLTGVGKASLGEYRHTWAGAEADYIADNLLEAVKWIIADCNAPNGGMKMENKENAIIIETATADDCATLAVMNRQLIDEGQQNNTMTVSELENRMRDWFQKGIYTGYVFKIHGEIVGYTLVSLSEMSMRHFFICRECRRQGYGRKAVELLFKKLGTAEIGLSCLTNNTAGLAFWRNFNHDEYSIKFYIKNPNSEGNNATV